MQQRGQDEQGLIEHPNAVASWLGVRLTRDATLTILFVETDLALDAKDEDYDTRAVEGLIAKVREFHAANNIDGADIIPVMD